MTTIFSDMGQGWLTETLKASAGQSVTYRRGSDSISVSAVFGRSEFQLTDQAGTVTALETHDFIFGPSDLEISGSQITPRVGDKVLWTLDGSAREYRVVDQPGFQPYKFDPLRKTIRVFTIKV